MTTVDFKLKLKMVFLSLSIINYPNLSSIQGTLVLVPKVFLEIEVSLYPLGVLFLVATDLSIASNFLNHGIGHGFRLIYLYFPLQVKPLGKSVLTGMAFLTYSRIL